MFLLTIFLFHVFLIHKNILIIYLNTTIYIYKQNSTTFTLFIAIILKIFLNVTTNSLAKLNLKKISIS